MANVTLSASNHNQNAPWWWKRLETSLLCLFTGLIPLLGLSTLIPENWKKEICLVVLPGLIYLVKTIGIGLGSPPPDTVTREDLLDITTMNNRASGNAISPKNPAE